MTGTCKICLREELKLTKHHLIPKATHKKYRRRGEYSQEEMQTRLLLVCRTCHSQIHALLSEKELATDYNTVEDLLAHPEVTKYTAWIRKRKFSGRVPVRKRRR